MSLLKGCCTMIQLCVLIDFIKLLASLLQKTCFQFKTMFLSWMDAFDDAMCQPHVRWMVDHLVTYINSALGFETHDFFPSSGFQTLLFLWSFKFFVFPSLKIKILIWFSILSQIYFVILSDSFLKEWCVLVWTIIYYLCVCV